MLGRLTDPVTGTGLSVRRKESPRRPPADLAVLLPVLQLSKRAPVVRRGQLRRLGLEIASGLPSVARSGALVPFERLRRPSSAELHPGR